MDNYYCNTMDDNKTDNEGTDFEEPEKQEPFHIGDIHFQNPIAKEEKFHAAVRDGDVGYVEDVLTNDKNKKDFLNVQDKRGRTPLTIAIMRGNMRKLASSVVCTRRVPF